MAIDKKYYLLKDGTAYFSDFLLDISGSDFMNKSLMNIELGEKATRIGEETFAGNYLRKVVFHKKMKVIEGRAFANNKIEKIVFERAEIPRIAKDAFANNPIKLIVVPYAGYKCYSGMLLSLDLPDGYEVISDIANAFAELNASLKGDEIIYIEVKSIYGELYWKIKKESSFIFDTRLNHDQNEDDFTEIVTKNGNTVFMHTDEHFDMIIYEKDENGYKSVTFEDFDGIYYEKGKTQC